MEKIIFRCKGCGAPCTSNKCAYCQSDITEYENIDKYNDIYEKYSSAVDGLYLLNNDEYKFILESVFKNNLSPECELNEMFINLLSKRLVEDGNSFTIEEKEELFKSFVDMISKKNNLNAKLNVIFYDGEEKKCKGLYVSEGNVVGLSRELLDTNPIMAYSTVFHELTHARQNKEIKDKKVSVVTLNAIMDIVNRECFGKKYYDDNYGYLADELEAFMVQYDKAVDYFESLNVEIPEEIKNEAQKYKDYCRQAVNDNLFSYRKVNEQYYPVGYLLAANIYDKPEYLERYPQLKLGFKLENNRAVEKSSKELEKDYSDYLDGKISWNGDKEEISQLYLDTIRYTKMFEEQLAQMTTSPQEEVITDNKVMGYGNLFVLILVNIVICIGIIFLGTLLS